MHSCSPGLILAVAFCITEGAILLMPNSAKSTVIADKAATLECYTTEASYSDLSFYFYTPQGQKIDTHVSPVHQYQNGGIRVITTFTMTAEYNGTRVVCYASGPVAFSSSQPVIILVQAVPPKPFNGDVRVCKLGCQVFFSWTPVISVSEDIDVSYNITDNHDQNMTINKPYYSLKLNNELDEYEGAIVMVLRASAFNQVAYSEPKTIRYQLSDTNLTLGISSISLENEDIKYNFTIRSNDLNQCSFNNLTDEKFIACDHRDKSLCKNNSVNVDYQESGGELVFSSTLNSLRRKFNSILSFDYLGVEIETDRILLSTHLIQNVTFNERCANFAVLGENSISLALHFQHKSGKELIHRVNVSKKNALLCSPIVLNQSHHLFFLEGVGDWSVYVYDTVEQEQPAVELHNVNIAVNDTILVSPPEETSSEPTTSSSFISGATKLYVLLGFCLFICLTI